MPSRPLDIGDLSFARKGDAAEHFRQILRRHDPGVALSEPDATHVYWLLERHKPTPWLASLLERKPPKLVAVALANKFARIAWRLMISGGVYNRPVAAMPT